MLTVTKKKNEKKKTKKKSLTWKTDMAQFNEEDKENSKKII